MRAGLCLLAILLVATSGATGRSEVTQAVDRPLRTAIHLHLPGETYPEPAAPAFSRAADAGASFVRLPIDWSEVAPTTRPAGFDAESPSDPAYRWDVLDNSIRLARRNRLNPIVFFFDAPAWALRERFPGMEGTLDPDPAEAAKFAKALARRYSGSFARLPRVRYWQVWNEPNISLYYRPQLVRNRPISPDWYREMLVELASAVRSVRADNVVIAGGTAPFYDSTPEIQEQRKDWGPLTFMRELLCLSDDLKPTCNTRLPFDVWAHHPYTSGGPTHHAVLPDDVSLGDLPEMKRVLDAATKAGHIAARGGTPEFWVTEFSWDSRPPDPKGVPVALLKRWVPEALYRMWTSGVSLVTWFTLRDQPLTVSYFQSGLYLRGKTLAGDRPKPYLTGFRFPFVAFRNGSRVFVWGRAPAQKPGLVVIEQRSNGIWKRLGAVQANRFGIFQTRLDMHGTGDIRARLRAGQASLPFSLKPVPDHFYNPFGQPKLLEPPKQP